MNPETLRESPTATIRESVCRIVRARIQEDQMLWFKGRPEQREEALQRLSPETLRIHVLQIPPISKPGIPMIAMTIASDDTGESDPDNLPMQSAEEKYAIWGHVSSTDFKMLCEECAMENVERYEQLLLRTPAAELDRNYNEAHTYRSLYEMELGWARESLRWVQRESTGKIKQNIGFF